MPQGMTPAKATRSGLGSNPRMDGYPLGDKLIHFQSHTTALKRQLARTRSVETRVVGYDSTETFTQFSLGILGLASASARYLRTPLLSPPPKGGTCRWKRPWALPERDKGRAGKPGCLKGNPSDAVVVGPSRDGAAGRKACMGHFLRDLPHPSSDGRVLVRAPALMRRWREIASFLVRWTPWLASGSNPMRVDAGAPLKRRV